MRDGLIKRIDIGEYIHWGRSHDTTGSRMQFLERSRKDERIVPIGHDMDRDTHYRPHGAYGSGYMHAQRDIWAELCLCLLCLNLARR
jgi:hypothetical protein